MNYSQLFKSLTFISPLWCFIIQPVVANEIEQKTNNSQLEISAKPSTRAADLLAQETASRVVKITGVKLTPTDAGFEVVLESNLASTAVPVTRTDGNTFIAELKNAVLTLPEGQGFQSANPAVGITSVSVTQIDETTIEVSVIGTEKVPTATVKVKAATTAQQPAQPELEESEEEIVVTGKQQGRYRVPNASTATKTDTPLRDVPQSIQVIPQKVIEDQKVTRVSEVLRNVSGVTPQGGFGGNTDNYNIRGFTTYDNLRNGYYSQDGAVNPTNIERIEVLKGPASVLYGQFEPGGLVNYVTKKPLSEPYYFGEFIAGSFNTYRPSIDISGPLNADKSLLYRLNAAYENSDSFIDFVGQRSFAIAPTLTYKISESTSLSLEYEYLNINRTYYDGSPPDPALFKRPISLYLGEPDISNYRQESNNVSVSLDHRFSENIKFRSAFSAQFSTTKYLSVRPDELDADGRTVLRRLASDGFSDESPGQFIQTYAFQNELTGKFKTGPVQHEMLLGLELSKYVYGYDFLRGTAPSIDLFNPVYGASIPIVFDRAAERDQFNRDTVGIYLQDQITLLSNLKLLIGGRYEFINRKNTIQPLDDRGQNFIGEQTVERLYDEAFSPRVGIVYQPIPAVSLYASYSRSFNPSSSRTEAGALLPPERGTQFEVGIKAEAFKGKLSATLAAYEITKTNVATFSVGSDFPVAAGEVKSRGIELDIAGEILPGWNVIASFFVNNAFVSKDESLPIGDKLVNAPSQGGSLWTTYEIQKGDFKGLGFGGGVFFVGDREAALPNTFIIPSYVRADATIFYKRDNWKVGLNFKNLFNTTYFDSQGFYLRPGAPLTVLGSISVEF